ncbi:YkgJ family cysteine cluster protein [Geoalkalibacter halelectricus]|uniref:YkgJ family cysteine cluster protein n=1 Tax=Geoalkalibacter halelectricus TaxID=2847045 RepID=UPI003D20793E
MPNGWQHLQKLVEDCHTRLDEQCARQLHTLSEQRVPIHCRPGCDNCCNLAVNATLPEALRILPSLGAEQLERISHHGEGLVEIARAAVDFKDYLRRRRRDLGACPLLEADGQCGVYSLRPLACRALFSTRDSAWCAADFSILHPAEKEAFLSSLDPRLVAFPTHYLAAPQELGRRLEDRIAETMAARWGFSVSGSLAFLLFLEQRCALSGLMEQGLAATTAALERAGYHLPVLIHAQPI